MEPSYLALRRTGELRARVARAHARLADCDHKKTYVNLMDQYRPCYRAEEIEPLARPISRAEWNEALALADAYGLTRLDGRPTSPGGH